MSFRLQRLRIALLSSRLLFLAPLIVVYFLLPTSCISMYQKEGLRESRALFVYLSHSLVTMLSLLWTLSHLQIWIDSEGEEALRASRRKMTSNGLDVIILLCVYLVMTLPVFTVANYFYSNIWPEWFRFGIVTSTLVAMLYVLAVSLDSVTMAALVTYAYSFLSVIYGAENASASVLLLKPHRELYPGEMTKLYFPAWGAAAVLFLIGHMIETRGKN